MLPNSEHKKIHTADLVEKFITLLLSLFETQFLMNQNDSDSDKFVSVESSSLLLHSYLI